MSNFLDRLIEEKTELHSKMTKLDKFLKQTDPNLLGIKQREQTLLHRQLEYMSKYYAILHERCYLHGAEKMNNTDNNN